ncbi:hypothetical protein O6P37_27080 [Mycobacterium sp. CPCC 205372]|uniref:ESX-1 secretion-associated protein EspB PE domain-containing protein n=1 Tax=Mycobacterium hippophais TaxID=3016340 RepID=A0ABT4Q110_9MYCO|nr:hypothetical protein [Mycobacterium hippophais]MCZ8382538.1 hypothetical protein [Mycobacterium hippophais]
MTTLKADPTSIRAKATKINGEWPAVPASPIPPDQLALASNAIKQIVANRDRLNACIQSGKAEASRLAACLEAAAKAYEQVDEINKGAIESGTPSGSDAVTINPVLPPTVPVSHSPFPGVPGNPYAEWTVAAEQLAQSNINVLQFADEMYAFSDALTQRAKDFSPGDTHWEGLAAEAADGSMRRHESWLYDVAAKSRDIAKQAQDFYHAHERAKAEHPEAPAEGELFGATDYAANQHLSETIRGEYSSEVSFSIVEIPEPPAGAYPPTPVFRQDVPPLPEKDNGRRPGSPAAGGGGGGEQPGGTPGETPAVSPASAQNGQQTPASGQQSGGSPSGGQGSGGSPSGGQGAGGSPAGGGAPTGLPEGLTDMPTDPAIRPASAEPAGGGGPGSGSGGGGGGGGGGTPNSPLAPAASASAPSSSPAAVSGGGAAPVGAAGPGGAMGGMPMGGGHGMGGQGGGAKERRRTPGLSPDEELYVEDRPSTEPVIGLRPRRGKDGGQDKEST